MPEPGAVLGWVVPAVVVFGVAAAGVLVAVWLTRRATRGPRAQAAAARARARAGTRLVALDDAVDELELEVGLSGALYGGEAPASLRRTRMTAQHVRAELFEEYSRTSTGAALPGEIARASERVAARADAMLVQIARSRAEHAEWMRANVSASEQIAAARARLVAVREALGDPEALLADLARSVDPDQRTAAERAATTALAQVAEAARLLDEAQRRAGDPSLAALPILAEAERALRAAQKAEQALDEEQRRIADAATAAPAELASAREALRQAAAAREALPPADAERLGTVLHEADAELARIAPTVGRRPVDAVERVARLRDRLDLAVGDARTAQQRLRGARTALPGALGAARNAIAAAAASVHRGRAGADARARLRDADREFASAQQSTDPVEALDAARRAVRHAEDAKALADYDRLTRG